MVEDLELDDAELLASLEAQEEGERVQVGPVPDSGYGTLSETATLSSRSSSMRSLFSTASARWVVNVDILMLDLLGVHRRVNIP